MVRVKIVKINKNIKILNQFKDKLKKVIESKTEKRFIIINKKKFYEIYIEVKIYYYWFIE